MSAKRTADGKSGANANRLRSEGRAGVHKRSAGGFKLWARVVRGLEWVSAAEAEVVLGIPSPELGHRDLVFPHPGILPAHDLRCLDDVFLVWSDLEDLDQRRTSLARLDEQLRQLPSAPAQIPSTVRCLRVTASFLGRRNYSRFEIEQIAGRALATRLGLYYAASREPDRGDAVWCRIHLWQERGRLGIRMDPRPLHRRSWRRETVAGALHPPVAAAMARLSDLHPGEVVLDPFAGSGTLLIEAGLQCQGVRLMGCDISEDALTRAREHARLAEIRVDLIKADARTASLVPADRVISNPPWGRAVDLGRELSPRNLVTPLLRHLKRSGRSVLLTDQALGFPDHLKRAGYPPLLVHPLRVSGRLAHLIVVGTAPCFPETPLGSALSRAWEKQRLLNGASAIRPRRKKRSAP